MLANYLEYQRPMRAAIGAAIITGRGLIKTFAAQGEMKCDSKFTMDTVRISRRGDPLWQADNALERSRESCRDIPACSGEALRFARISTKLTIGSGPCQGCTTPQRTAERARSTSASCANKDLAAIDHAQQQAEEDQQNQSRFHHALAVALPAAEACS